MSRTGHMLRTLFSASPVVRPVDRLEALLTLLAVALALLAFPIAFAVAGETYATASATARAQAESLTRTTATLLATPHRTSLAPREVTTQAQWQTADGLWRTGPAQVPTTLKEGDQTPIWIDETGNATPAPTTESTAATAAIAMAISLTIGGIAVVAALLSFARALMDRARYRTWAKTWSTTEPLWTARYR